MFDIKIIEKAKKIKLVIFDVDGVLTDGRLYFDPHGNEMKVFHVHDGFGVRQLLTNGIEVAIISGRESPAVAKRMARLGIQHVYQGQENKVPIFEELLNKLNLDPEQIAYIGDDLLDIPLIKRAGLGMTVPNAYPLVKEYASFQTENAGGYGAAREVCDLILLAQGKLELIHKNYLL